MNAATAARHLLDHLGEASLHGVLEGLPHRADVEKLAVLEHRVLEPAVATPHQDDDEIVVDDRAALRGAPVAVRFEQTHDPIRDLRGYLPASALHLLRFARHSSTVPQAAARETPRRRQLGGSSGGPDSG
jgi:hypothetical protein